MKQESLIDQEGRWLSFRNAMTCNHGSHHHSHSCHIADQWSHLILSASACTLLVEIMSGLRSNLTSILRVQREWATHFGLRLRTSNMLSARMAKNMFAIMNIPRNVQPKKKSGPKNQFVSYICRKTSFPSTDLPFSRQNFRDCSTFPKVPNPAKGKAMKLPARQALSDGRLFWRRIRWGHAAKDW